MLKQTYLAKVKDFRAMNPGAEFIEVTRSKGHILSPSWELLNLYKQNHDWDMYTRQFIKQMDKPACWAEMKRIWDLSQTKDVYLVCFEKDGDNCHRHILIELIKKDYGKNPGETVQAHFST